MDYTAISQMVERLDELYICPSTTDLATLTGYRRDCVKYSRELCKLVRDYDFGSEQEEIHFFKEIKPQVVSRVFYYTRLYKIEVNMPPLSIKRRIEKYREEIKKLDHYALNHAAFQRYLHSGDMAKDSVYFTRGYKQGLAEVDYRYIEMDHDTTTAKGFVLARLMAHDRLHRYLRQKIALLKGGDIKKGKASSTVEWVGKKVNLVVLMYGLIETRQVACDVATLAEEFKRLFNIEINDTYRTWLDVKARKKEPLPWMKEMVARLEEKIREEQ